MMQMIPTLSYPTQVGVRGGPVGGVAERDEGDGGGGVEAARDLADTEEREQDVPLRQEEENQPPRAGSKRQQRQQRALAAKG